MTARVVPERLPGCHGLVPGPARPDPAVVHFLQVERDYLLGEWTAAKIAMSLIVPLTFAP